MKEKLFNAFAARAAAILIDTDEPEVTLPIIQEAYQAFFDRWCRSSMLPAESDFYLYYWDLWKGLRVVHADTLQEQAALPDTASFMAALEHINAFLKQAQQAGVFIFAHTRPVWAASPAFSLAFEDLLKRMNWAYQGPARIVLCGSTGDLPPMIANMVSRLDLPYPGLAEIKAHLSATTGLRLLTSPPGGCHAPSHRRRDAARQAGTRRKPEDAVSVITDAKIACGINGPHPLHARRQAVPAPGGYR